MRRLRELLEHLLKGAAKLRVAPASLRAHTEKGPQEVARGLAVFFRDAWLGLRHPHRETERPAIPESTSTVETVCYAVEFVGGPLDGHRELLDDISTGRLEGFLQLPVTRELVTGNPLSALGTATSIAFYELGVKDGIHLQYRFCGAGPPVSCDLTPKVDRER